MPDDSIASNEPNLNAFYTTPQYCLEITHAHAQFLQWQDKPGGPVVAGTMAQLVSHWADVLLPEAERLNVGMRAFRLWRAGIVDASGVEGGIGERAGYAFRTVDQLWPKVEAELERLREAAISEATGQTGNRRVSGSTIWKWLLWPFGEVPKKGRELVAISFWLLVALGACWFLNRFLHWGIDLNRFEFWRTKSSLRY
ncbi:MAG: hypothetical protein ABSB33_14500 [Tepidisphaeraceae bacterium]|jgi:hypothetical protein